MFDLVKEPWYYVHKRSRSPFFAYLFLGGSSFLKNDVGLDYFCKHTSIILDKVCFSENEIAALRKKTIAKLEEDPEFLLKLMKKGHADHKSFLEIWKKLEKTDMRQKNAVELADYLHEYVETILQYGVYVVLPFLVESHLTQEVKNGLEKRFPQKAGEYFHVAVDPVKSGSVIEEKISLLKIAEAYKKGEDITKKLAEHVEKFSWMKNVGYFEEYYTKDHYLHAVKEAAALDPVKEIDRLENEVEEKTKKFNELIELCKNDAKLSALINTVNEAVYFRSYRTEVFYSSAKYVSHLFNAIAEKLGLEKSVDVLYLFPDELQDLLRNGKTAPKELIEERKKAYVYASEDNGKYFIEQGQEAIDLDKKIPLFSGEKHSKEIKGQPAFVGKVQGTAAVVHNLSELSKVKQGSIIVTHTTNVNFVPALKLVVGIVTEEGGILSHASVISRELKIPAVIGTKTATQLIKDGDLLEVDSEKGVVRIL